MAVVAADMALKLSQQDTKKYKAAKKAEGGIKSLIEALGIMEALSSVVAPLTDFFSIFGGVMEAGLAESTQKLAEALFTESNIELITKLAEITAKLVNIGLIPLLTHLEKFLPLLEALLPYLESATNALDTASKAVDNFYTMMDDLPSSISKAVKNLGEDIVDGINDWGSDIIDALEDLFS